MGSVSTTASGRECQAWAATTPHVPVDTITDDDFPDGSRAAANNYCRNPNGYRGGPWCHTTDPNKKYEKCDIPVCADAGNCKMKYTSLSHCASTIATLFYDRSRSCTSCK